MSYDFTPGSVLYDGFNHGAQTRTRVVVDDDSGLPLIVVTQDTRPIVEANKRQASLIDKHEARKHRRRGAGWVHVARIPEVIWRQLQAEGIAQDQARLDRWMSERDNRVFRVDDGRRLA